MREGHGLGVRAANLLPLPREVGKDTRHAAEYHVVVACGVKKKSSFANFIGSKSHKRMLLFVGFNPFFVLWSNISHSCVNKI